MARIKTGGLPQKKKGIDPRAVAIGVSSNMRGIDSGMLLNEIIGCFGGTKSFAKQLHTEWVEAKAGSLMRKSIMETINRLTIVVTSQEIAKPKGAEDMEDDELMDAAAAAIARMQANGISAAASPEA